VFVVTHSRLDNDLGRRVRNLSCGDKKMPTLIAEN